MFLNRYWDDTESRLGLRAQVGYFAGYHLGIGNSFLRLWKSWRSEFMPRVITHLGCPHFMDHELQNYSILFQEVMVFVTKRRPCAEDRETSWCEGGQAVQGVPWGDTVSTPKFTREKPRVMAWKVSIQIMWINHVYRGEHWSWEVCTSF